MRGVRPRGWSSRAAGLVAGAGLASAALLSDPAGANPLVAQARDAGILDAETAAVYGVLDLLAPELLPAEYRADAPLRFCGTPALVEANHYRASMSPENRRLLGKVLQRPLLESSALTPGGHFRVHYGIGGRDGVDPLDAGGNGSPDYIDTVMAVLDRAWDLQVRALGYRPPPGDGGDGGGTELDVYILDLGRLSYYGLTYPESFGPTTSSYLELDNDYTNSIYGQAGLCPGSSGTRELEALRVTVAHEFFHMIQFGYYQGRDGSWWQEASSTWMEDVAYPEVDDYLQYVCAFLGAPERSLDSGRPYSSDYHPYGAALFAHFLDQRYRREAVRCIWEELGRRASADLSHFDRALRQVDADGLSGAVGDFGMWNFFTGRRHRGEFYAEGEKYPEPEVRPLSVAPKVAVRDSGHVDHLATAYVHLVPHGGGGITVDTQLARGDWRRQLVLAAADTLEVLELGEWGPVQVPDWDGYEQIVLSVTNTDLTGIGFAYAASVEYDPDLGGGDAPVALSLGDGYPNPFRPAAHGRVLLPYELDRTSHVTRLSLFGADGRMVRRYDLGKRARRAYQQPWDGRNDAGELVGSGIYYWVLEADGRTRTRALAVVRE